MLVLGEAGAAPVSVGPWIGSFVPVPLLPPDFALLTPGLNWSIKRGKRRRGEQPLLPYSHGVDSSLKPQGSESHC